MMGVPWIFECVHYLLHGNHEDPSLNCLSTQEMIFRAFDVVNLGRGLLIFYIFVCKKAILSKLVHCGWNMVRSQPADLQELERYLLV